MATTDMNQKPWLVLLVTARSAVSFVVLAIVVYTVYTFLGLEQFYWPDERLVTIQVLFYLALAVHMTSSIGVAAALIIWSDVTRYPAFVAVGLTFALLTIALIYTLSAWNQCATGVSFPIPAISGNCGD